MPTCAVMLGKVTAGWFKHLLFMKTAGCVKVNPYGAKGLIGSTCMVKVNLYDVKGQLVQCQIIQKEHSVVVHCRETAQELLLNSH